MSDEQVPETSRTSARESARESARQCNRGEIDTSAGNFSRNSTFSTSFATSRSERSNQSGDRLESDRKNTGLDSDNDSSKAQEELGGGHKSVQDYFFHASKLPTHRFGKRVHNQLLPNSYESWDFLKHRNEEQWTSSRGLSETKFHKGFYRKHRKNIEAYHATEQQTEQKLFQSTGARRDVLRYVRSVSKGFDPISGIERETPRNPLAKHDLATVQGRDFRHPDYPSLAPERQHVPRGKKFFENSRHRSAIKSDLGQDQRDESSGVEEAAFRFYKQTPNTANTKHRMGVLRKEGLPLTKHKSSLLGYGRAELSSRGTADNFEHSYFMQRCKSNAGF